MENPENVFHFNKTHLYFFSLFSIWSIWIFKTYILIRQNNALGDDILYRKLSLLLEQSSINDFVVSERQNVQVFILRNRFHILYTFLRCVNFTMLLVNWSVYGIYSHWKLAVWMTKSISANGLPSIFDTEIIQSICFNFTVEHSFMVIQLPILFIEMKHKQENFVQVYKRILKFTARVLARSVLSGALIFLCKVTSVFTVFLAIFVAIPLFSQMQSQLELRRKLEKGIYRPIPQERLRLIINELATSLGFPEDNIFLQFSRRGHDASVSAKYTGPFLGQCIVVTQKFVDVVNSKNEIVAVVAHELGHWKLNHLWKSGLFYKMEELLKLLILYFLIANASIYEVVGFPHKDINMKQPYPIFVGCYIITNYILGLYTQTMTYIGNYMCTRFEYESDKLAAELGYKESLKRALIKINQSPAVGDHLYLLLEHKYPCLLDRLEAIDLL